MDDTARHRVPPAARPRSCRPQPGQPRWFGLWVAAAALLWASPAPAQQDGATASNSAPASESATAANTATAPPSPDDAAKPAPAAAAPEQPGTAPNPEPIVLREYTVLPKVGDYRRTIISRDPIDALIVSGEWRIPQPGDKVTAADGKEAAWRSVETAVDGVLATKETRGGYAVATVTLDQDRVMVLEAQKHAAVRVNGGWLAGDPYGHGWLRLPVQLEAGDNELLFHMAQPGFQARLVAPPADAYFIPENATLPDFVRGQSEERWAAVPVVNATGQTLAGAELLLSLDGGEEIAAPLPSIPPLSAYKAPIRLPAPAADNQAGHTLRLSLKLPGADDQSPAPEATLRILSTAPDEAHVRTFVSKIDGGVQPYTLLPAADSTDQEEPPGVILALHSEGVDHRKFADNYLAKPWAHIVAPSNRGEYGFDWEDWGATDAMEALADAQARLPHDPRRVYCTGHSMGGHGAWRLGVVHPDRFAAVGASAGWLSLWSYGGGMPVYEDPTPVEAMLLRAASSSDTLSQLNNLGGLGVYVLHGDRDSHVGVSQSRFMRTRLGEFHPDFAYFERKGAGNWWGAACCDWPAMMEFFRGRSLPEAGQTRRVDFATPDLGLAANCHWARIETQDAQGEPSEVSIRLLKESRAFIGATENVRRLSLDPSGLDGDRPVRVKLDGGRAFSARPSAGGRIWLSRDDDTGRWSQIANPPVGGKSPTRHGGFKSAFDNNAILIYSTGGSDEENAWSLAKARYDAQSFWCRGNGALQVVADKDFDAARQPNRNVVLYGNADTNLAWPALLSTSPVRVRGGKIVLGGKGQDRAEDDAGLAALFVRPRPRSNTATVGVVAGADLAGMRLTDRIRYFHSGVGLPDITILGPESPAEGDYGVRAVGYFGHDWSVDSGDIAWRDTAL
ncbi:Alpha/beta hydrolase family protein [Posidoniimonas corsicana]|uniref:Alpha/beta hydrolase family protein n=1 Tax=Posidoniimonas corsicana TaxID=1938618 RepID=A0A5C5VHZ9_9BACT|nr:alpha/beta hydrolase-fold protein [Posidoniimonas corsicana]TWT38216.1 Alpha/beta hydrolase family protein [Posidoniimonas corsicana]